MSAPALRIMPYDESALYSELSALLAAAPVELRGLNLHDAFTFARGVAPGFDDGLADFDATDFLDLNGEEIDCEDFGP